MDGIYAYHRRVAREEERQLTQAIVREYNLSRDPEKAAKAGGVSVVEAEEFLLGCGFPIAKTSRP